MTTTLSSYPIVGILGRKQSGKSTLARYLVEDHCYTEHAYADPLRELALALDQIVLVTPSGQSYGLCHVVESIGWDTAKEQIPEVRRVLQRLGTDVFRAIDEDVWVDFQSSLVGVQLDNAKLNSALTDALKAAGTSITVNATSQVPTDALAKAFEQATPRIVAAMLKQAGQQLAK